jgi:hypothetical protein
MKEGRGLRRHHTAAFKVHASRLPMAADVYPSGAPAPLLHKHQATLGDTSTPSSPPTIEVLLKSDEYCS